MKHLKNFVVIGILSLILGCQKNPEDACNCLKKAANTYMLQGVRPSEYQLAAMCSEYKGQLDDKDKREIVECLAEIKRHIEDKELFSDVEKVSFNQLPQGELLLKEIKMAKGKFNDHESLRYFLAKRPIKGVIAVSGATDNPHKINWDNASSNDPKNFLVQDGKIMVNGYVYDNQKLVRCYITLLVPEKDRFKILSAKDDIIVNSENQFDEDHVYNQLIEFEGVLNDIVINKFDEIRPTFDVVKYNFIKPDKNIHKISNDPKSRFFYGATTEVRDITEDETMIENISESSNGKELRGIVAVEKAYLYNDSDVSALTKAYIVKGQEVKIIATIGEFYDVVFTNESGRTKEGFLKIEDLEKI